MVSGRGGEQEVQESKGRDSRERKGRGVAAHQGLCNSASAGDCSAHGKSAVSVDGCVFAVFAFLSFLVLLFPSLNPWVLLNPLTVE